MKISISEHSLPRAGAVAVAVHADKAMGASAKALDKSTKGALSKAMNNGRFTGAKGQIVAINAPTGLSVSRIVLFGLGKADKVSVLGLQDAGGKLVGQMNGSGEKQLTIVVDAVRGKVGKVAAADAAAEVAFGASLASYRFDKYRTTEKADKKPTLKSVAVAVKGAAAARKAWAIKNKIANGVVVTRDLVSEPGNVLYPVTFAAEAKKLSKLGVKVEVMGAARMAKLGMHAMLGVAAGSQHEAQFVVMQWNGAPASAKQKPLAVVGKGVTFDSGGISLKPGAGMGDMKWDMGGAGVVVGLMTALAGRKAKANVVGVIGLVENMPSGTAQKPGDVVKSMSGQTIEIDNTDAEGRLVLADALWYTQKRFKPSAMIDLATLTGAMIMALGHVHAGLFASDDDLANALHQAGNDEDELVWRMPLHQEYDNNISSDIADVKNTGREGAGSITAAQFLKRFTNDTKWAHLDIAGMTWSTKAKPTVPKGGTGFGVRLLDRLVADNYEV
ncbi:MAG: leucyl aminopeptidase [Alphaproteobacteria bacterium]|jgi:leucyl aminopeptidase|nr:leucyl aminopeptidase [Alphaproteobacteria bacterium]MBT4019973.1 leucyl aminopeptidase [Alphaproteobacteria bacterium]MBT4966772.1 leucyl aminopeptidase [Alphaproteobacteria bacterium]MBT5160929.1 leucyl aminopeptidase [Alphaproteobacteria bacterium]MBT5919275.1 leucyl aminopeptidase [Alphaproteobacteria bacterium]